MLSFKEFEELANQAGIKEDGKLSAKQQRDWLRQYWGKASTGEVKETYIHACLEGAIAPVVSAENFQGFLHFEINPLVQAGVLPAEFAVKNSGAMGEFFGAVDEDSF